MRFDTDRTASRIVLFLGVEDWNNLNVPFMNWFDSVQGEGRNDC